MRSVCRGVSWARAAARPGLSWLTLPLAHPLTQPFNLPVSPLVAALLGAGLVLLVALTYPQARARAPAGLVPLASWDGALSGSQRVTRLVAVGLLALTVAAGRLGEDDELENLAPALVVGALWPLLVLTSVLLGPVWRWTDPWDGIARAITRDHPSNEPGHVWPAALVAIPWVWYLSAYSDPLSPRSVGAILALYTLLTVAGCLAFGRRRWLATSEPLGIVLSWMALLPRGQLSEWTPPRGGEALLGVLAGGVLFGAVRRSELWGSLNTAERAELYAAIGLLVFCAAATGLLAWMTEMERLRFPGTRSMATAASVPAVAGIIVAVAMDRNRLFTSVQLLPGLLGDPFGRGWSLLGEAGAGLDPAPLGTRGLLLAQLAVLLAGHLVGSVVVARRAPRRARVSGAVGLAILAAASVIALASH